MTAILAWVSLFLAQLLVEGASVRLETILTQITQRVSGRCINMYRTTLNRTAKYLETSYLSPTLTRKAITVLAKVRFLGTIILTRPRPES